MHMLKLIILARQLRHVPADSECSEGSGAPNGQLSLLKNSSLTIDTRANDGVICTVVGDGGGGGGLSAGLDWNEKWETKPVQGLCSVGSAGK